MRVILEIFGYCNGYESHIKIYFPRTGMARKYYSYRRTYKSNQQLYDLMCAGWRNIPGTLSTLYLLPTEGVTNLIDIQAKCHAHFLSRCLQRLQNEVAYTAAWLKLLNPHFYMATALHMGTILTRFPYLGLYFHEICYMTPALRNTAGKYHSTSI